MILLELQNVHKSYEYGGGTVSVLNGVDLTIEAGQTAAVIGPSGTGKSTLLNIMGGLDRPSSGSVIIQGRKMSDLPDREIADFRNRDIGFVFQRHLLLPQCTVWENVLIPTLPRRTGGSEICRRANELLDYVGLQERKHHRPAELSGGECQRVAVVRAVINKPSLILADEPTGSLDEVNTERLIELLLDLNREVSAALVLVTHSSEVASRMQERYSLHRGQLEAGN